MIPLLAAIVKSILLAVLQADSSLKQLSIHLISASISMLVVRSIPNHETMKLHVLHSIVAASSIYTLYLFITSRKALASG